MPHQSLGHDFLLEILRNIGVQQSTRRGREINPRQCPVVKHAIQVEIRSQFLRAKAGELVSQPPPTKQIAMPALELACTGATESKTNSLVLMQPVNLVEESGNFLDFIDHHKFLSACREFLPQKFRVRGKPPLNIRFQQVHPFHSGVCFF